MQLLQHFEIFMTAVSSDDPAVPRCEKRREIAYACADLQNCPAEERETQRREMLEPTGVDLQI